ncbi:hypothetical protein CLV59_10719 [Chitinophaga dinghuensis]|uniref:Glycosyl hydrolase family 95 catalytic domain-containing protein n=1 Tax=Chitinophaga dinghuensis TaxID=1539050 RepID=A0A327VS40_9BACT|nr:hypothetical protein [Chitinophaga dinghuensis]RAJ77254.1 hypothetical protein CLV59_10719 [Chitinophaga dinghuensis]
MNRTISFKKLSIAFASFLLPIKIFAQTTFIPPYQNIWTKAPQHIPSRTSTDAPLMGNGDLLATLGQASNSLTFYISKNDFGQWTSKYGHGDTEFDLAGSRILTNITMRFNDLKWKQYSGNDTLFSATQDIWNGQTTAKFGQNILVTSWVSATQNLIFIKVAAQKEDAMLEIRLRAPDNESSMELRGQWDSAHYHIRSFSDDVDIRVSATTAVKMLNYGVSSGIIVKKDKPLLLVVSAENSFKGEKTSRYIQEQLANITEQSIPAFLQQHNAWWTQYWQKSSVVLNDTTMMKSYYQGLYTMAACSRNPDYPPGLFGWITNDRPLWNNDYHLNYNFEAPFYSLYAANRLEQALPHDAPILAFMPRGKWYAENVTHTRGVLYPVGIGPKGVEVTRQVDNFYTKSHPAGIEKGGMFWQQRSNAAYALLNMGQYWYSTYDTAYARKIYPYALSVAEFWEDYMKFEDGRYIIYNDAIHEGSGRNTNPILSLGLVRNVFSLMIDMSRNLNINTNEIAKWENILNHISQFPTQKRNGRTVFRYTEKGMAWNDGNGLGIQHIYPASAITLDSNPELLAISRNTIAEMNRWKDQNTSSSFFMAAIRVGFSGDTIYDKLHDFITNLRPNGFIKDNVHGIENSCIITNAVDEMLCMSVGNVIRLFPSLPSRIDASFSHLRAYGAFLVSAERKAGEITNVEILSEKGRSLTMVNPWGTKKVKIIRQGTLAEMMSGERFTIATSIGERISIVPE